MFYHGIVVIYYIYARYNEYIDLLRVILLETVETGNKVLIFLQLFTTPTP